MIVAVFQVGRGTTRCDPAASLALNPVHGGSPSAGFSLSNRRDAVPSSSCRGSPDQ